MPPPGGASGKLGDHYELLWAVDAALRVIRGDAQHVTYESLKPDDSRGVEFNLLTSTGTSEFWSIKRQTTAAAGWTLAALRTPRDSGRSILEDLITHAERDHRHIAVFASTLGAATLEELRSAAASAMVLKERLAQANDLDRQFQSYLLPLFDGDQDRARIFLTRLAIRTADETSLRTNVESTIALLFYSEDGKSVDSAGVRRILAEYMLTQMHQTVDAQMLLDYLATHRLRRMDWKKDVSVRAAVKEICDAYTTPLRNQLIGGMLHALPGVDAVLRTDDHENAPRVLISGGAGGGKSSVLATVIERLRGAQIPVLPLRMDANFEGIHTPQRLGDALSLPASPVAVLAGIAEGGTCVLVVDQLDAVSLVSGRRTEVWALFERLLAEADGYPNMRVMVACRAFDLEHDYRMRSLRAQASPFEVVTIGPFNAETVDSILGDRKVHSKLRPILNVPLHLAMFLSLELNASEGVETSDQLFEAFWVEKQRRCSQRLGSRCNFADVIDWLATRLSDHQELTAPAIMLPGNLRADADVLLSEHVIVLANKRYRFFHETFFDYAFARRFAQAGGRLVPLLLNGEQHLFRRAQVRQVLSFLRANDPQRYLPEARSVLMNEQVRFHVKQCVLEFLSATPVPARGEWDILCELEAAHPRLRNHVNRVIANDVGWFDTLDAAEFLDSGLSSGEKPKEERIAWLCAMPEILKNRSARVASLMRKHRRDDEVWRGYLRHICQTGDVFHSREMFELFLSLIRDGTMDGKDPDDALSDGLRGMLYTMSGEASAMAVEAIAAWVDRRRELWNDAESQLIPTRSDIAFGGLQIETDAEDQSLYPMRARSHFGDHGHDHGVIVKSAAGASLMFVEQLLPRVAMLAAKFAAPGGDCLNKDILWSFRPFGGDTYTISGLLVTALASCLEETARSAPEKLDQLFQPFENRPEDTVAYLLLRAWTAAPDRYAERLAQYLADDPRRLKVGYAFWGGGGGAETAEGYRSIEAVRAASPHCSPDAFASLENAIVDLRDEWESAHPQRRGWRQLQLLAAMDQTRLGQSGRAKLAELRTKFPSATHQPPTRSEVVCVGSPIPANAQEKMTDGQWLSAMRKYSGVKRRIDQDFEASGGEHELAQSLESRTKSDPKRFVALTEKIPSDVSPSYFDAILRGVAALTPADVSAATGLTFGEVIELVERAHALPGRPCGRWIVHLIRHWGKAEWPPSIVEIAAWYATEDPDPAEEVWRKLGSSGQPYYGGDPDMSGLNSTRGAAAGAVAELLFAKREPAHVLVQAVERLAIDPSIAVRSQAVHALLALLNTQPDAAIRWFIDCVRGDPVLLQTRFVERFVHYAAHRDYAAIRPVLGTMIGSEQAKTVESGARLCCLLDLSLDAADEDAERVRTGSRAMREAAASVYATNIANKDVGALCRAHLIPFFSDSEESVRTTAATAFRSFDQLKSAEQTSLLGALLDASPNAAALEPALRAVEDSSLPLPQLVCRLIEAGIERYKTDASDIRTHAASVARSLSKLVIRLYTQCDEESVKKRCLDAIDVMNQASFFGLEDELGRIER